REAAEIGIALEIIEQVGADRACNDLIDEWRGELFFARHHYTRYIFIDPLARKSRLDRLAIEKIGDSFLILVVPLEYPALVFECMAVRDMSNIVQQSCGRDHSLG